MINLLSHRQEQDLKDLAGHIVPRPYHRSKWYQMSVCARAFTYGFVLYTDLMCHAIAAYDGKPTAEGYLTLLTHFLAVVVTFPVEALSTAGRRMCASFLMILIGVTNFEWYTGKELPEEDVQNAESYVVERKPLERKHMISISRMAARRIEYINVRFNVTLIILLPMLILKAYFAVTPQGFCAAVDVTRLVIIFMCIYETVVVCTRQEFALVDYLKASNFQDVFERCLRNEVFNSNVQNTTTFIWSLASKTASLLYRIHTTTLYFSMSFLFGFFHVCFLLLTSFVYHVTNRPIYENPTFGTRAWFNDFTEIWARIFFMRAHRMTDYGKKQVRLGLIWAIVILFQHVVPLYTLSRLLPWWYPNVNGTWTLAPQPTLPPSCQTGLYGFIWTVMDALGPDLSFVGTFTSVYSTLGSHVVLFTAWLALAMALNLGNYFYLSINLLNDERFPGYVASDIWTNLFLSKRWGIEPPSLIERMLVMAVVDSKQFRKISARHVLCRSGLNPLEWRKLATVEAHRAPALPDLSFMQYTMLDGNTNRDKIEPLIVHVYSMRLSESCLLRKLLYIFVDEFDGQMLTMTSPRLSETYRILKRNCM